MYLSSLDDLFHQEKVELYNNIAGIGGCKGRLKVDLYINPIPILFWDFESKKTTSRNREITSDQDGYLLQPIKGYDILIDRPYSPHTFWSLAFSSTNSIHLRGSADRVIFGNEKLRSKEFHFFLTDFLFPRHHYRELGRIQKRFEVEQDSQRTFLSEYSAGRIFECLIDSTFSIQITFPEESMDLLENRLQKAGSMITAKGKIIYSENNKTSLPRIKQVVKELSNFCLFLSFANGGYVSPIIIEGASEQDRKNNSCIVSVMQTTPIEIKGQSWVSLNTKFSDYVNCYPEFKKLLSLKHWGDDLEIILDWYFQIIQPLYFPIGKKWPILANAIGATLEKLYALIVVNDLEQLTTDKSGKNLKAKIEITLQSIGIDRNIWHQDYDLIDEFIKLRNDATHAFKFNNFNDEQISVIIHHGIQWIEEILLWRLGYHGMYENRNFRHEKSISPRYDLSLWKFAKKNKNQK